MVFDFILICFRFISKDVDTRVRNIVNQVLKERTEKNIVKQDLLQSLLEMKEKHKGKETLQALRRTWIDFLSLLDFDDFMIPGHSFSFLTEGYETSSLVMSFTLYEVIANYLKF